MNDRLWDTWDYLAQGGWVMVPIAACSLLMWMFILERWLAFARLGGRDKGLIEIGGRALIDYAIATLHGLTPRILISANRHRADYAGRGWPVLADALGADLE